MEHELKILPQYFEKVLFNLKNFEIRYNDRNFTVGDILCLKEFEAGSYTGRSIEAKVIYLLSSEDFPEGLKNGYVILGIKKLKRGDSFD